MNHAEIFKLLNDNLTVKVYPDAVPESAPLPAVSYVNLAYNRDRVIQGRARGKGSVWRVTVVATALSEVESVLDELTLLDNTNNADFQRIFVEPVNVEAKIPESPYRRAFVDLRVYN